MNYKDTMKKHLRKNGKTDFLSKLNSNSSILDVGCGNNSPFRTKQILPDCIYTGLDVGDYNQTKPLLAENYVITTPQNFSNEIAKFSKAFDAVISSHNLEHCDDREMTLTAMLEALKVGGKLYLSFPCEQSVNFPRRGGTLNYYDDSTHKFSPPNFNETLAYIKQKGFEIVYAERNYSPKILSLIGWACEPLSKLRNKIMVGTWEYYGFESIIIAEKVR
jgi:SAM-dependent methyltransferase